ncbi:MAG: NADH:ubiquinone oxidoreductase subunit 2, partial [Mariprofundaceae bacterium]|nr:NADH:ubiquinone oxidoreductase subunit 2 [Mariprofundaceae bacterium]
MANVVFPFPFPEHLIALLPEIIVALAAMFILLFDLFLIAARKKWSGWLAIITTVVAADATIRVSASEPMVA